MIKKTTAMLLVMIMAAAMTGCGEQTNVNTEQAKNDTPQAETPADDITAADAAVEDAEIEDEHHDNELVLRGSLFEGLENLKNENKDDGTYFYEDMTSDGITVITNMSAPNSIRDDQDMDAYVINFICALIDNDARVEDPVPDEKLSVKFTYPVYETVWESGSNEDTKKCIGVTVLSDLYTYYYGFSCPIDYYEENEVFFKSELSALELETAAGEDNKDEERNIDADAELMDYYGHNIDELMSVFPELEISSEEGIYDKNGAQYLDKEEEFDGMLSGPSFDVDSKSNIVGITYSGRRFTLAGLCAAMTIDDAIKTAKEDGWKFSDVGFAHGTAQYVANYTKDDMTLTIVSTDEGEFGKSEESDLTGSVETVSVSKQ